MLVPHCCLGVGFVCCCDIGFRVWVVLLLHRTESGCCLNAPCTKYRYIIHVLGGIDQWYFNRKADSFSIVSVLSIRVFSEMKSFIKTETHGAKYQTKCPVIVGLLYLCFS